MSPKASPAGASPLNCQHGESRNVTQPAAFCVSLNYLRLFRCIVSNRSFVFHIFRSLLYRYIPASFFVFSSQQPFLYQQVHRKSIYAMGCCAIYCSQHWLLLHGAGPRDSACLWMPEANRVFVVHISRYMYKHVITTVMPPLFVSSDLLKCDPACLSPLIALIDVGGYHRGSEAFSPKSRAEALAHVREQMPFKEQVRLQ